MSNQPARTFSADFRLFFVRGLAVLLPTVLTIWIVVKAYQFVDDSIAEPINRGVRLAMVHVGRVWDPLDRLVGFEPTSEDFARWREENRKPDTAESKIRLALRGEQVANWWAERWYLDLIGLIIAIIGVYVAGRLLGGFLGRRAYKRVERFITALPIFKQVYPYVKQIVEFIFADEKPIKFRGVVVVEYPRKGIWSVGFLTGPSLRSISRSTRSDDVVTVFIPSSPTPFTGYTITVPRTDVQELPITVEEAIRFAVSAGVLVPEHELMEETPEERAMREELDPKASGLLPIPGDGDEPGGSGSEENKDG